MKKCFWLLIAAGLSQSGCATMKNALALNNADRDNSKPIHNPFGEYYAGSASSGSNQNIILRTKKGDRSVEVELPGGSRDMTDFVIPVSPAFKDEKSGSADGIDNTYMGRRPTIADREIAGTFPASSSEDEAKRRDVEDGLGLRPEEQKVPERDESYLAATDRIKQLYRNQRFEAALIETEDLIRLYPTDPKLYEMRGTLLDRLGKSELAIRSWDQALRLNPKNQSLKKFLQRKRQIAGVSQ